MRGLLKRVVSEPGADTAESFVRRIRILAAIYTVLFFACCTQAEHKLPVIPSRSGWSAWALAKRADPVATMGFATLMVLLTLAVMVLFVIDTPWVPG